VHAELDQNVGPKLQRMMRHSTNETSASRAEMILRSGLGDSVDRLADDYGMDPDDVRALIVDFNVRRMKAISRKRSDRFTMDMNGEDQAIVDEMIRLTPQAFGLPDMRWLPDELISFIKEHGLVRGIDPDWITARLREHRFGNSFRPN
jgi:hypothetical protein